MLRIIRNKVVEEYLPTYLPTYLPACLPISASFSSTARVVVVIIIIIIINFYLDSGRCFSRNADGSEMCMSIAQLIVGGGGGDGIFIIF